MTWLRRLLENKRLLWLFAASLVYLLLAMYQLGLPGLHYDEAKEAGVNAMELIYGEPVTAFRGATLDILGAHFPLMVQDYIGALNVYLAAPILALTGVGVPNLRVLSVLTGLLALLFAERAISEWLACCEELDSRSRAPISVGGLIAVTLLAVSPSFVFWSRQGLFVTNLMQPLCFLSVWQGLRWMRTGKRVALVISAFAGGLALYAKLQAVWIIAPFALLMAIWWAILWSRQSGDAPTLTRGLLVASTLAFLLPLAPFFLFNVKTGGTMMALLSNAGRSYYGVDNLQVFDNLRVRGGQLAQVVRGEQFWYLGGSYANVAAPWLALAGVAAGLWRSPRCVFPPLLLVGVAMVASAFTISDLFVTHYALVYPFAIAAVAIALDRVWRSFGAKTNLSHAVRAVVGLLIVIWFAGNLIDCLSYHRSLAKSGGLADHSDASYHLAYFLRYNGLGAPIVLDWGMDAQVRFLSQGTVAPIEIFGYDSLSEPDAGFAARLDQFLGHSDNVYLLHAPQYVVFEGRREAFLAAAEQRGLLAHMIQSFAQRDGQVLYELWRVE